MSTEFTEEMHVTFLRDLWASAVLSGSQTWDTNSGHFFLPFARFCG